MPLAFTQEDFLVSNFKLGADKYKQTTLGVYHIVCSVFCTFFQRVETRGQKCLY